MIYTLLVCVGRGEQSGLTGMCVVGMMISLHALGLWVRGGMSSVGYK